MLEKISARPFKTEFMITKNNRLTKELDQIDLTRRLAEAVANFGIEQVEKLLAEDGEYNWMNLEGEVIDEGSKQDFLSWLSERFDPYIFTASQQLNYEFDQCIFCKVGNPVVLFESGHFPVQPLDPFDRDKQGLMLEFEHGMINKITFCVGLLKTENNYQFQCCRDRFD